MSIKLLIPILCFLLLSSISLADYTCQPSIFPTTLTTKDVQAGQSFTFTVTVNGLPSSTYVKGVIRDLNNNVVETTDNSGQANQPWSFSFQPITTPGAYAFEIQYIHPATGNQIATRQAFLVKASLSVTLGISDYIQFINKDIHLSMTVVPNVDVKKTLIATIKNVFGTAQTITLVPAYTDKGGGVWDIDIPAGQLQSGTYDLTINLQDAKNVYSPTTQTVTGVNVQEARIILTINAPSTATYNVPFTIKVTATDASNTPVDLDRIEMDVTYAGGGTGQTFTTNDFIHTQGTGVYSFLFTPTAAQQNYFMISAFKGDASANQQLNIPVGGGPSCACDTTQGTCQSGCSCDPDCGNPGWSVSTIIAILIAVAIVMGVVMWILKRH